MAYEAARGEKNEKPRGCLASGGAGLTLLELLEAYALLLVINRAWE